MPAPAGFASDTLSWEESIGALCYMGTPSLFLSILPDLVLTYLELQSGEFFWNSSLETGGRILPINHPATSF
jgi:hypothetical protein